MMIKKKSNPWARLKYAYVLPLATVAVAAFDRPEFSNQLDEISSVKVNDLTSIVKADEVKSVENSSDEKIKVSGTVLVAETKIPVIGASVIVRGTTHGALTDFDGKFALNNLKKGDVIQISFVGYQTQSVIIKDEAPLTILMKDDVQKMEEMVVVGYAAQEKGVVSATDIPEVKKEEAAKTNQTEVIFEVPMEKAQKDEPIFQVVEEMPKFPGGLQEAMVFIGKNIKYPVAAQEARIEGRVIVQFVVGKDGSVSDIHTVRGVSPELDAEAIRVVSMMPKWIPGKQRGKAVAVKYTMPIMFRLKTPEPPKKEEEAPAFQIALKVESDSDAANVGLVNEPLRIRITGQVVRGAEDKLPLVVVDGKVMGRGTDLMEQIEVSQIQSISVLKDDSAMAEYGEQAKDGAIIIITKNEKK